MLYATVTQSIRINVIARLKKERKKEERKKETSYHIRINVIARLSLAPPTRLLRLDGGQFVRLIDCRNASVFPHVLV